MSLRHILLGILAAAWMTSMAGAQAVQLPTYRFFGLSTTVMVPDQGGAYLGGVNSAQYGSRSYGPGMGPLMRNRSSSQSIGSRQSSVHATIIDLNELDQAVLAEGEARAQARQARTWRAPAQDERLARYEQFPDDEPPLRLGTETNTAPAQSPGPSVEELRRRNDQRREQQLAEAEEFFAHGNKVFQEGKFGAAKIFYQMALRRADSPLREQVQARLDLIEQQSRVAENR